MKYKMIAIDMDGTFLRDDKTISKENLSAVKRAINAGVKVVVCSGRVPFLLKPILKDMPEGQPLIAGNGSIIFDHNNKEIYTADIDRDTVFKIIDILRSKFDNVYYHFFNGDIACSEKFDMTIKRYYERNFSVPRENRVEFNIVPDSKKYIEKNNCFIRKIEINDKNLDLLMEIKKCLEKLTDIEVVESGEDGIEITKKGINKGNSLEILARYYGYSKEECIGIGNDGNDLEMIKKAGMGVAVNNAKHYIKDVANYITEGDNNNNAVAEVIYKFIDISA